MDRRLGPYPYLYLTFAWISLIVVLTPPVVAHLSQPLCDALQLTTVVKSGCSSYHGLLIGPNPSGRYFPDLFLQRFVFTLVNPPAFTARWVFFVCCTVLLLESSNKSAVSKILKAAHLGPGSTRQIRDMPTIIIQLSHDPIFLWWLSEHVLIRKSFKLYTDCLLLYDRTLFANFCLHSKALVWVLRNISHHISRLWYKYQNTRCYHGFFCLQIITTSFDNVSIQGSFASRCRYFRRVSPKYFHISYRPYFHKPILGGCGFRCRGCRRAFNHWRFTLSCSALSFDSILSWIKESAQHIQVM